MLRRAFVVGAFAGAIAAFGSDALAQERIPLMLAPRPEQVIHTTTTQQAEMQIDGTPVSIQSNTKIVVTHTIGARDAQGPFEAVITFDEFSVEALMNGQPAPMPPVSLAGHAFTAAFDENSHLSSVKASSAADEPIAQYVNAMLTQAFLVTDKTIAVGETVTTPLSQSVALPGMAAGMQTNGQQTMTLVAIERVGGDRIARFDQKMETSTAAEPGGPPMSTQMSGGGKVSWNLDRGYVTSSDITMTLEGDMMQTKLHGTVTIKTTGSN